MITLFRKIRQSSFGENRVSKYMLYAIGEIILVVIGILIALQVSNWNSENELKKLEIKYLEEIRNNLKSDISDIDFNIAFNQKRLRANKVVLEFVNGELKNTDSLNFHLANLIFTTRTLVNSSAYENLKSRGLEIISDDSLRQTITTLYAFTFHNVIDFETQDDHKFQYESFIPEVSKALKIKTVWKDAELIDSKQLANNYQFKNTLLTNMMLREYMQTYYVDLKEQVEKCINSIELELKNLK